MWPFNRRCALTPIPPHYQILSHDDFHVMVGTREGYTLTLTTGCWRNLEKNGMGGLPQIIPEGVEELTVSVLKILAHLNGQIGEVVLVPVLCLDTGLYAYAAYDKRTSWWYVRGWTPLSPRSELPAMARIVDEMEENAKHDGKYNAYLQGVLDTCIAIRERAQAIGIWKPGRVRQPISKL